jgi:hypothetical protein
VAGCMHKVAGVPAMEGPDEAADPTGTRFGLVG